MQKARKCLLCFKVGLNRAGEAHNPEADSSNLSPATQKALYSAQKRRQRLVLRAEGCWVAGELNPAVPVKNIIQR
jgi:hypothetical protein